MLSNMHIRTIQTPSRQSLVDFDAFSQAVIARNKSEGLRDAFYQRQSGRTTKMIIDALDKLNQDFAVAIIAHNNTMCQIIKKWFNHYAEEYNMMQGVLNKLHIVTSERDLISFDYDFCFVDNAIIDMMLERMD